MRISPSALQITTMTWSAIKDNAFDNETFTTLQSLECPRLVLIGDEAIALLMRGIARTDNIFLHADIENIAKLAENTANQAFRRQNEVILYKKLRRQEETKKIK
jgi:hypothetical protein